MRVYALYDIVKFEGLKERGQLQIAKHARQAVRNIATTMRHTFNP